MLLWWWGDRASRAIALILCGFWLVMGLGYHGVFFTRINPLAYVFALLFVAQAGLFAVRGFDGGLKFALTAGPRAWVGGLLIAYGLVAYPLVGLLVAHPYPATPLFGVAPCPTVIFTLGLLVLSNAGWTLFVVPLLWSVIGGSAAVLLGVPQDYGLIAAGTLALLLKPAPGARSAEAR